MASDGIQHPPLQFPSGKNQVVMEGYSVGCANKDLLGLCAPIFIIVVYSRTATSYFLGAKE